MILQTWCPDRYDIVDLNMLDEQHAMITASVHLETGIWLLPVLKHAQIE